MLNVFENYMKNNYYGNKFQTNVYTRIYLCSLLYTLARKKTLTFILYYYYHTMFFGSLIMKKMEKQKNI
jgi:hypothetical protein